MFRDKLRELMQTKNLTAKDLASMIETDEDRQRGTKLFRVIENWAGKRASMPSADRAVAIAKALGVSVEYMVEGKDSSLSYDEIRLLSLAKKNREILEALDSMDYQTRDIIKAQIMAVAVKKTDGYMVAEREPGNGSS